MTKEEAMKIHGGGLPVLSEADLRVKQLHAEDRQRKLGPTYRSVDENNQRAFQQKRERALAVEAPQIKHVDPECKARCIAELKATVEHGASQLARLEDQETHWRPIAAQYEQATLALQEAKDAKQRGTRDRAEAGAIGERLNETECDYNACLEELERARKPRLPDLSETATERKAREGTGDVKERIIKNGPLGPAGLALARLPGDARPFIEDQAANADERTAALWPLYEHRALAEASKSERLHSMKRTDAARFVPDDEPESSDFDNLLAAFAERRRLYEERLARMRSEGERLLREAGAA